MPATPRTRSRPLMALAAGELLFGLMLLVACSLMVLLILGFSTFKDPPAGIGEWLAYLLRLAASGGSDGHFAFAALGGLVLGAILFVHGFWTCYRVDAGKSSVNGGLYFGSVIVLASVLLLGFLYQQAASSRIAMFEFSRKGFLAYAACAELSIGFGLWVLGVRSALHGEAMKPKGRLNVLDV